MRARDIAGRLLRPDAFLRSRQRGTAIIIFATAATRPTARVSQAAAPTSLITRHCLRPTASYEDRHDCEWSSAAGQAAPARRLPPPAPHRHTSRRHSTGTGTVHSPMLCPRCKKRIEGETPADPLSFQPPSPRLSSLHLSLALGRLSHTAESRYAPATWLPVGFNLILLKACRSARAAEVRRRARASGAASSPRWPGEARDAPWASRAHAAGRQGKAKNKKTIKRKELAHLEEAGDF